MTGFRRLAPSLLAALLLQAGHGVAQVSVRDFYGRQVQLDEPARRIVALAPNIVENVFSAGAGDRLVGVVDYSDHPPAARDIPRIGNFHTWSLEAVVALLDEVLES